MLVIFDDGWELEFLQKMVDLSGVGVQCLVTSQDRDWGRGLSASRRAIQIQVEGVEDDICHANCCHSYWVKKQANPRTHPRLHPALHL